MSALPMQLIATDGTALIRCTVWLGFIHWDLLRFCVFGSILLCGLVGGLYVWCDLWRIEANLRDILAASKFKQAEDAREKDKSNRKPLEPACESEQLLRHAIKLRRKAFLLRRNADKLDNLLCKPLRRLRLFLRNKCMKAGTLIRMVSVNVFRADRPTRCVFRQINNESLDVAIHKTQTMPNDQHQRWEPAAADTRTATDLNGWLPSAECCG